MNSHTLEEVLGCSNPDQQQEKRLKPLPDQSLKCPRCESTNTKFCYYNNYSLSQPRYFCKGCRRYWTQGGSLRNVPVGGGCRKNKRTSTSSSTSKRTQDQTLSSNSSPLLPTISSHPLPYDPSDLSLAFARLQNPPTAPHYDAYFLGNPNVSNTIQCRTPGFLDILRGGYIDSTGAGGFHNGYYGFGLNGSMEEVDDVNVLPVTVSDLGCAAGSVKPEFCRSTDGNYSKVVMGNMGLDYGRDYWGNVGSSHPGLVNSSLM